MSCNKQPRRVFVELYCTKKRWWRSKSQYIKTVEVCGSLSAIHCDGQDLISGFVFSWTWYKIEATCDVVRDINNCIENILNLCIGYRSCDNINVNTDCFYLTLRAAITYSCNRGTGSPTTTVNYAGNHSYFDKEEVSPRTIVFDMTKPPNTGENELVLDVDSDFRLLIINKKRNTTYSLCANRWKNEYAKFVCRFLHISDNGIACNVSRNINLTRIAYGVDCPVNITNPFECIPDYSNSSRDICESIGDATVKCYNHTENYILDKAGLTGILVGGILGFIFALVIIVVFICCRRKRNKKENKRAADEKRENASTTANYHRGNDMHGTGEQERVSLMTKPEATTQLDGGQYFVLDPGATGFNRSNNAYSDSETQYATSSDGVYDVTNERRHTEKDEINIYSHTVDDVYDTSAHDRRGKERDNAYDDFCYTK
ncbi:uncharacterized protein LOC134727121 [Mytilus trossulus]|uniref:uncharacterized protein LOC134727121 n=1 Tax=Mytilus trossulus TaxID=6551 RepID=UPI00300651DD